MGNEEETMTWKEDIDDIKIVCKKDGAEMILQSNWSGHSGIYSCPKCHEYVNIKVRGYEEKK